MKLDCQYMSYLKNWFVFYLFQITTSKKTYYFTADTPFETEKWIRCKFLLPFDMVVLHHLLPLLHLCTRVLYLPEEWLMLLLFLILYCQPLLFNILYSIIYIYYLSVLQKVFKRQATSFLLDHIDTKAVLKGTLHKVVLHCL